MGRFAYGPLKLPAAILLFLVHFDPKIVKFAKSKTVAPTGGWGPIFLSSQPLFLKPGPPKKWFGTFFEKRFRNFVENFSKKIAAAGGPWGPEKPKWSEKVVKSGLLGLLTHLNGPK